MQTFFLLILKIFLPVLCLYIAYDWWVTYKREGNQKNKNRATAVLIIAISSSFTGFYYSDFGEGILLILLPPVLYFIGLEAWYKYQYDIDPDNFPPAQKKSPDVDIPSEVDPQFIIDTVSLLDIPNRLGLPIAVALNNNPTPYAPRRVASGINALAEHLPTDLVADVYIETDRGAAWGTFLEPDDHNRLNAACMAVGEPLLSAILSIPIALTIPEKIRTQHQHIVAGTGHGKTELIKSMVLDDVEADHSVVVIDSQNDMINELATKLPPEKLILVDPIHCPPALNLFMADTSSELFEYIFSALDAEMTSKQGVAYRFVSQMVVNAKGNIHTMRQILEPGDEWRNYVNGLGETATSFFETEYSSRQFNETRQQILRRLYTLLENEVMERMLSADESLIDIKSAVDSGKVVLISTAKDAMRQAGASLLGRIFIAQVMNAVMSRKGNRKRTYLYVDEFQDYAEDSHVLFNLFEQARKYELGLIVAHQYLGQIPPQLTQSLAANTAIKFAGGLSSDDTRKLANQMHTTPDFITSQPKGTFAAWVRDHGTLAYGVELGRSANTPNISQLSAIRDSMRTKYSPKRKPLEVRPSQSKDTKIDRGTPDVPETGEW